MSSAQAPAGGTPAPAASIESPRRATPPAWLAVALGTAGLVALYWGALRTRFLNDDYVFLEEARTQPLARTLFHVGALGNYYRPLSRQIYYALLAPLGFDHPLVFHVVNALVFALALALLVDLLRALLPWRGVMAGALYFALLPFQRVNLMWVSCSQDLLALAGALGAFALYRRGRLVPALLVFLAALASKETALALPLALVAWDAVIERRRPAEIARRVAPFVAMALAWGALAVAMRVRQRADIPLAFTPLAFIAALAHLVQSVLGLDHPAGFGAALAARGPALVPLLMLGALAWWYGAARGANPTVAAIGPAPPSPGAAPRAVVALGLSWMIAFALPAGPVVAIWSSYYYTLAAAGAAAIVGLLFARGDAWTWVALTAGLLWWHAGGQSVRAFAVTDDPVWTSHLTPFYFERAATLTDSMSRQLRRLVPSPPPRTRFFFAALPSYAGFQMGNGAQIRHLYGDTTLASYFYSQISDSTADRAPSHFLFWNGRELEELYGKTGDPWFQVGSDLLLLERQRGAEYAFRRGLAEGGDRMDLLYWLGWAQLWNGEREAAEATWRTFGAVDDSLRWRAHLRAAHNSITERDTIEARRHLATAIQYGIGRPEGHAVLGELLLDDPRTVTHKYALLELKVAAWLNPGDWDARRSLALGLAGVHLTDQARVALERLVKDFPELANDTGVSTALQRYRQQDTHERVVDFARPGTKRANGGTR